MKKAILAISLIAMFLMISIGFAELPNQQSGPLFDDMRTVVIKDMTAAIAALMAKEVDVMKPGTLSDLNTIESAGFRVETHPLLGVVWEWLNLNSSTSPELRDVNFRRAIAHLIPKEEVLEEYYGPLGTYAKSPTPTSIAQYYNPDVPDVTVFDPEVAAYMLDQAGYTKGQDGWRIDPETGVKLNDFRVSVASENPVGYQAFCTRWVAEMIKIGIPAKMDYTTYSGSAYYTKWFVNHDFDSFQVGDIASAPDLQAFGRDLITGGRLNAMSYSNPEFDNLWNIYQTTQNLTEQVIAGKRMQEIVVEDLPIIPLYMPTDVYAVSPDLVGWAPMAVQAPFYWIGQKSELRLHWKSGVGGTFTWAEASEPGNLIIGYDTSLQNLHFTCLTCDFLMDPNPYTGTPEPWVATNYKIESWSNATLGVVNGSKTTFSVRDDFYWHDGVKFTAYDIEFAAKYGRDNKIANLNEALKDFVDATAVNETLVSFYYNRTSVNIVRTLTTIPYILSYPKHLYNPNASLYGLPEGPMGLQQTGKPGVPEPSKFAAAFVPYPNPPADKPWLTCFIGIGPWIFKSYEWGSGAQFIANRNYPIKILVTDVNFDRNVNIVDMARTARSFGTQPGNPRWNELCDINGDFHSDIVDIALVARDFGKSY